ncbi:hypothetical protein M885DRAFT_218616 [Pelagophyceae sp. CCMP2097]|nr:hypothetical protein M885DRAFT_218616 [Pelagophyceae sp. CCMP2097]
MRMRVFLALTVFERGARALSSVGEPLLRLPGAAVRCRSPVGACALAARLCSRRLAPRCLANVPSPRALLPA